MSFLHFIFLLLYAPFAQSVMSPGPGLGSFTTPPVTLVAHSIKGATSSPASATITTTGIDSSGANFIACVTNNSDTTVIRQLAPTDSKSNTWTPITGQNYGPNINEQPYYAKNAVVGTSHTFSVVGLSTTAQLSIACAAFSNINPSSPLDVQAGTNTWSGGTTRQFGSVTPSNTNSLVLSFAQTQSGQSDISSVGSGFTISDNIGSTSFINSTAIAYLIETSIAAQNPTWTRNTVNGSGAGTNAVFHQ